MPFPIGLAITGISALAGLLGKPKPTTTKTESNSTTNSNSSLMPQYDDTTFDYRNRILSDLYDQTQNTPEMYNSYVSNGLQSINATDSARERITNQILSARGFGASPSAAYTRAAGQTFRLGQQANLLTEAPLKIDQARQDRLKTLAGFFGSLPVGNTQNGTSTTKGTSTTTADPNVSGVGSALQSGASMAGFLVGKSGKDWWK